MSDLIIAKLMEQRLRESDALPPIQAENTTVTDLPRVELHLIPADSRVVGYGNGPSFSDSGILQATLCYAPGIGVGDTLMHGELIKLAFENWKANESGVHVHIQARPVMGPAYEQDGVVRRPVSIRYSAYLMR